MTFIALILLNITHWLGDYTHLSTNKMLAAKRFGTPIAPIFAHALVHSALFFGVVWSLYGLDKAILAGGLQLVSHYFVDLLKGKLNKWLPVLQSPANRSHWYIFGADQFLHQAVIVLTVAFCTY